MLEVWQTDATYIKDYDDFDENRLVVNKAIMTFLNTGKSTRYFVVATKGFGKTFLLRYKRLLYQEKHMYKGYNFIPKNQLVDKTLISIDFSKKRIDLFSNEKTWKDTWELAIIISFIKSYISNYSKLTEWEHSNFSNNLKEFSMANKLLITKKETPLDYLAYIIKLNLTEFNSLRSELEDLRKLVEDLAFPTAIFIDDIDEIFIKHLQSQDGTTKSSRSGALYYNVWYFSQIGLMKAVRELYDINSDIKIFASIRKEAYIRFKETDEKSLQFKGDILDLNYTQAELEEMFSKNIQIMDPQDLVYPNKVKADPIFSFLGIKKITNRRTGEPEEVFSYIYRHTLKRPRDVMSIGDALNQLDNKSINEIINTVNSTSEDIAKQYIEEVAPHIDLTSKDFEKLFILVHTKIISKKNLKKICGKFNSNDSCNNDDCKNCTNTHVFCNLYKIGLLGIVKYDYLTDEPKQYFLKPGELTFNTESCLPESPFYFVHPVLTKYISENSSSEYMLDRKIIVGDGYYCNLELINRLCIENSIDL